MQGLFKLGIVGTKDQMQAFLQKILENALLSNWVIGEEPAAAGGGLRVVEGHGMKPFLDRYKIVLENGGSGNISGMEEVADEISRVAPELEVLLLTRAIDYDSGESWLTYYSPAGETKASGGQLDRTDGGPDNLDDLLQWRDMGMPVDTDLPILQLDFDEMLCYAQENDYENDFGEPVTREDLDSFLDFLYESDGEIEFGPIYDLFAEFMSQKANSLQYHLDLGTNPEWNNSERSLPTLEYVARLFAGCWGIDWGVPYRLRPTEFDDRFAGKTFVVTGEPDGYDREELEELIQCFGGVVRSSVSGKTNYLIVGEDPGERKLEKARELGTPILNTDEFENMISPKE